MAAEKGEEEWRRHLLPEGTSCPPSPEGACWSTRYLATYTPSRIEAAGRFRTQPVAGWSITRKHGVSWTMITPAPPVNPGTGLSLFLCWLQLSSPTGNGTCQGTRSICALYLVPRLETEKADS